LSLRGNLNLVDLAFGDHGIARQVSVMVQQQVQLHRSLRRPELRPVEHRRAQVDNRRIQTQQFARQAELRPSFGYSQALLAIGQQLLKYRLEQLPRPVTVRICQVGACRCFWKSQMLQLPFTRLQSFRDLAQRFGLRQLAEQHGHELPPAAEAARVPLGLVFPHRGFEAITRDQLENLAEDAAYSFQGEASSVGWIRSLAELNPTYQRFHLLAAANLDTSGLLYTTLVTLTSHPPRDTARSD
jgi:hypothetical protein